MYLKAFYDLSTCRSWSDPVGPIPWDKILEYGIRKGLEEDVLEAFLAVVRAMDNGFLKDNQDRRPKRGS